MSIDQKQKDFIALVMRSPDRGDGWRSVSGVMRGFTTEMTAAQPELYETREVGDALMIRLSERGKILADYL